jgi:hypothetical protein
MKRGRINFTYGANLAYFNDFHSHSRYGINPAVGFRLMGFHLINGYNILAGNKEEFNKVNTLYITLRYYFPLENKFEWDKKGREHRQKLKEKKKKAKAKEKKKKLKEKENENNKGIWKLFRRDTSGEK